MELNHAEEPPHKRAKLEDAIETTGDGAAPAQEPAADGAAENATAPPPPAEAAAAAAAAANGAAPPAEGASDAPGIHETDTGAIVHATEQPASADAAAAAAAAAMPPPPPAATQPRPQTTTATTVAHQHHLADTYCNRENRHKEREATGELQALYIYNDGSPDASRYLTGLKNVFSKCLPNMPKTYITRLVFDRRHRSVVIVRGGSKVIAGITYRPFHERRFGEIAFCAVAQTLQVSGIGTRLMNWTKAYARDRDACEYFLTYADNAAVGYFLKQGFAKIVSMPKDRWHGYIKDYDGTTLMECYIHPTLPHTDLPEMISAQRKALDSAVRKYTTAHVVHPGLGRWKDGEGGSTDPAVPLPLRDIPGVLDAGWDEQAATAASPHLEISIDGRLLPPSQENLNMLMERLLDQLAEQKDMIWPFLEPVDPAQVPDYYEVIKNPIDVSMIRQRLQRGNFYTNLDIFSADVARMFSNAKVYNDAETLYYKHAHKLAGMFQSWMNASVHYDIPSNGGAGGTMSGM